LKAVIGSLWASMPASSGKAQSSSSIITPLSAFCGPFRHGNFQQLQDDRLVLAQHFARGDAEQQGVTDLTSGAGDGNADGLLAHGENSRKWKKQMWMQRKHQPMLPATRAPQNSLGVYPDFPAKVNLSYVLYKI
jgi:hypothetical protein